MIETPIPRRAAPRNRIAMPTATITCPRCSRSLHTTKPFATGSRFRCPGCGAAFAARPADAPKRRSGGWLLLVGAVGLALLMLGGAGVALVVHFLGAKDAPPVAAGPPANAPEGIPDNKDPSKPNLAPMNLPPPKPPEPPWLPPKQEEKVAAAIHHGVDFLEKTQYPGGMWPPDDHPVGRAALPGLTLLECGVAADDIHIQHAATFVRGAVPSLHLTYELALGILFLDRLGDPADEPLIRTMAVRLLAGQKASGGWNYECPILSDQDENNLWTVMEATRPRSSLDLLSTKQGDNKGIEALFSGRPADKPATTGPGSTIALSPGPTEEEKKQAKTIYDGLRPEWKGIPALQPPTADDRMPQPDGTDNSNTQFATLGLWAAGRHRVPMERALALLAKRFQVSQQPSGKWTYWYVPYPRGETEERPAMTGAGLLGLAVGHGVTADLKGADVQAATEDPQVEKGMKALGGYIGGQQQGLYFLWSVERVGMLYGRRTVGDKEWYPWGADFLVKDQKEDGGWDNGNYPGWTRNSDTCFALLFLKRANLAKDLSSKLEFLSQVKKP
jgi:hypothetical protein